MTEEPPFTEEQVEWLEDRFAKLRADAEMEAHKLITDHQRDDHEGDLR